MGRHLPWPHNHIIRYWKRWDVHGLGQRDIGRGIYNKQWSWQRIRERRPGLTFPVMFYPTPSVRQSPLPRPRIGTTVMNHLEAWAINKGAHSIGPDCFCHNIHAIKMYKRLKYNITGFATYRKGIFYLMEKNLSPNLATRCGNKRQHVQMIQNADTDYIINGQSSHNKSKQPITNPSPI